MLDMSCFMLAEFKSEVYWFLKKLWATVGKVCILPKKQGYLKIIEFLIRFSNKPYGVKMLTRPNFSEPTSYPALLADFIVSQTGKNVKLFQQSTLN